MTHGLPDWGNLRRSSTIYTLDDLSELATRLKSPIAYDRRGNVAYFYDWSLGPHKLPSVSADVTYHMWVSPETVFYGEGSLHLHIASQAAEGSVNTLGSHPYMVPSKWGLTWLIGPDQYAKFIIFNVEYFNGTTHYAARIRYKPSTGALEYLNSSGAYVSLGTITVHNQGAAFVPVFAKIVYDAANHKYVRFSINQTEFDMSGIAYQSTAEVRMPEIAFGLIIYNNANQATNTVWDLVVITHNEP